MRAYNLFTEEVDFADDAVAELKAEFERTVGSEGLLAHTAAVIYTDSVLDIEAFLTAFRAAFSFPVLGCSGMTMFDRSHGVNRSGICVLLLTADDVEFVSAVTQPLERAAMENELRRTYAQGLTELGRTPDLILLFGDTLNVCPGDALAECMDRVTGSVALFGGLSSSALDSDASFVFTDRACGPDRAAMLLLAGDGMKNALMRYEMSAEETEICSGTVTDLVDGWAVGHVNGVTFLDRLKQAGIETGAEGTDYVFKYISNPFMVKRAMANGDEVTMLRNLVSVSASDGSAVFAGLVPEGARISMAAISKERVAVSSRQAFEGLLQTAAERGIRPAAFLCVSCKARYFNLGAERREEVDAYDRVLDPDAALIGMYSQGEFCPLASSTGGFFNIYHNSTIAILAL